MIVRCERHPFQQALIRLRDNIGADPYLRLLSSVGYEHGESPDLDLPLVIQFIHDQVLILIGSYLAHTEADQAIRFDGLPHS